MRRLFLYIRPPTIDALVASGILPSPHVGVFPTTASNGGRTTANLHKFNREVGGRQTEVSRWESDVLTWREFPGGLDEQLAHAWAAIKGFKA